MTGKKSWFPAVSSFSLNVLKRLLSQGCGSFIPQRQILRKKTFNSLPNNKILDQTKIKAFADNKLNVTKMIISVFDRVENL